MATTFEIRVASEDAAYCQQAAGEAFRRLDHLESLLSRFREHSEVCRIGRLQHGETMVLHPDTFACLSLALEMAQLTGGAFDPNLGPPLTDEGAGADLPAAQGPSLLLDPSQTLVQRVGGPAFLDLGAIGKGYALDCLAETLDEWEVASALLVAGGSSILAAGNGETGWIVGLTERQQLELYQGSIGCSGLTVKGQHILDPRTRQPAHTPARAWALSAKAAVSDALSTAFMLLPPEDITQVCAERPECAGMIQESLASPVLQRFGKGLGVRHAFVSREN